MTSHDIPQLTELERCAFPADAWAEDVWWAELAYRPRRDYIVAAHSSDPRRVVGYAGCDHAGATADVMTIAVAPSARGQGVGRLLLDWLLATAERGNAEALMLEVRADNTAAIGLYGRAGFQHIARRRRYYQPDGVDALVMRKLLTDSHQHASRVEKGITP